MWGNDLGPRTMILIADTQRAYRFSATPNQRVEEPPDKDSIAFRIICCERASKKTDYATKRWIGRNCAGGM